MIPDNSIIQKKDTLKYQEYLRNRTSSKKGEENWAGDHFGYTLLWLFTTFIAMLFFGGLSEQEGYDYLRYFMSLDAVLVFLLIIPYSVEDKCISVAFHKAMKMKSPLFIWRAYKKKWVLLFPALWLANKFYLIYLLVN